MGTTFVISGLKNKRARIAGEIAQTQRLLDQRRAELAQVGAVIRMFTPDRNPDMIPPIQPAGWRDMFFSYKELAERLTAHGMEETEGSIGAKLARGTFAVTFFLAVLELEVVALGDL